LVEWRQVAVARRLLASERGTIVRDWGGQVPVVLAYPNNYAVGMASLAVHGLYRWLNELPGIVCERAFSSLGRGSSEGGPLFTLESQRPVGEAAVLAFSISFEMDYLNVVHMLHRAHVPLRAEERDEADPLVLLGGPAVSANPEPLALLADAIVIGEVEPLLERLGACLREGWREGRQALLRELARLPGVYVPLLHQGEGVQRQWLAELDAYPLSTSIIAPRAEFGDMYLIEISRGCIFGCRFCLTGYWYRPYRERSLEQILALARKGLEQCSKLGLVAAAVSTHSQIDELTRRLRALGAGFSVSSLRVRPLSPILVQGLAESGAHSITLAPEAGTERLRRFIGKGVEHEDILRAVELAAKWRFRSLKLYFMFGLPTETEEDIEGLLALLKEVRARFSRQIVANLTPFVPKAHTPFERKAMAAREVLAARLRRLREGCRALHVELRVEPIRAARMQGVLARGDHRVGQALLRVRRPSLAHLQRALEEEGLTMEEYLREYASDEPLPWDFLRG